MKEFACDQDDSLQGEKEIRKDARNIVSRLARLVGPCSIVGLDWSQRKLTLTLIL